MFAVTGEPPCCDAEEVCLSCPDNASPTPSGHHSHSTGGRPALGVAHRQMEPSANDALDVQLCASCGREVIRELACVDSSTGELLCPMHYRARHFNRVLSARKNERWSTPGIRRRGARTTSDENEPRFTTTPASAILAREGASKSGHASPGQDAGALITTSTSFASPRYPLLQTPLPYEPQSGSFEQAHNLTHHHEQQRHAKERAHIASSVLAPLPLPSLRQHAAAQWAEQLAAIDRTERAAERLLERADRWYERTRLRSALNQLRASRAGSSLLKAADHFLVGRAFAHVLSQTLLQALRRGERRSAGRTVMCRRGMSALRSHSAAAWRLVAAERWHCTRSQSAAFSVLRWNASVRRLVARNNANVDRHYASTRLRHWRQSAQRMAVVTQGTATAMLRFRISSQLGCIRTWRQVARLGVIGELEIEVAMRKARAQHLRCGWSRWRAAVAGARGDEMDAEFPSPGRRRQPPTNTAVPLGEGIADDPVHDKAKRAEKRALAAEQRIAQLEGALAASQAALERAVVSAARERTALKAAFQRERDGLLHELGKALDRAAKLEQAALQRPDDKAQAPSPPAARRRRLVRVVQRETPPKDAPPRDEAHEV